MRETRTSGSEGGGTDWSSLPLSLKLIPQCQRIWPGLLPGCTSANDFFFS